MKRMPTSPVLVLSYEIFHVSGSEQMCCRQYREVKKSGQSALGFRLGTKSLICPIFPFVKNKLCGSDCLSLSFPLTSHL